MAIEPTFEEAWRDWYYSGDHKLKNLEDEMFPVLSFNEEFYDSVKKGAKGSDEIIAMGKVKRKYLGPKDNFLNNEQALKALHEIRNIKYNY